MPRLLVVDDESAVAYSFRRIFGQSDIEVESATTAAAGLKKARAEPFDVILLDVQLPDRSGLELFGDIRELDPKRPIIFITAHGTADTAIEAMKQGAFDYLVKPLDLDRLTQVVDRALGAAKLMHVPALLPSDGRVDRIIGRSAIMQEMSKAIGRIAPQDVNVLILGETGAGKELVARALYHHSRRADHPFLAINCAAIPENLLESELFGHEEGAFTGASRRRVGKFEQCAGGTLFLDEIGDMALPLQAKLLRVLQENEFEPVGGNRVVKSNVRVIAATNCDLVKGMADGKFRKDLYFRLREVAIAVPALRERREDISELAHHFLFSFGQSMGRDVRGFSPAAIELLINAEWPGNVRELQGAIKQALISCLGPTIEVSDFPEGLRPGEQVAPMAAGGLDIVAAIQAALARGDTGIHEAMVRLVERTMIPMVLQKTNLNQVQAAEILGLNRATLRTKLRDLGLSLDKVLADGAKPAEETGVS